MLFLADDSLEVQQASEQEAFSCGVDRFMSGIWILFFPGFSWLHESSEQQVLAVVLIGVQQASVQESSEQQEFFSFTSEGLNIVRGILFFFSSAIAIHPFVR